MSIIKTCTGINKAPAYLISEVALQEKAVEISLGINLSPDQAYSFLLKAPTLTSRLRIIQEDKDAFKIRFLWLENYKSGEYHFDAYVSHEGNLCDLHFTPVIVAESKKLPNAVASVVEAMSSNGTIRIGELRDYTQAEHEHSTEEDVEKIAAYLHERVLADLDQISTNLDMLHLDVSLCLNRLIDRGVVGCTPLGTRPTKLYYYK